MTGQYVPGTCNIGPEEIALRRRAGHAGLAVTAALAAALLRSDLHPAWRLTLALPAAGAASGYLRDALHHRSALALAEEAGRRVARADGATADERGRLLSEARFGYLQARQRFCANYGFRGLYNFDARGHEQPVDRTQAQEEDRRRALQITATSAAIGLGVALAAMLV